MIGPIDEQLIHLLEKDARQSSEALAKQLNVSPTTVRRRKRALMQSGVLRITALIDPYKIGLPLIAVIAFDVAHEKSELIMQELASRPEVKWVALTTGRFDILVLAMFHSRPDLW